jgi:glycerophosphoryl diester phosphodiesterase
VTQRNVRLIVASAVLAAGSLVVATAPAEASTAQRVWTIAPLVITRAAAARIVVTSRPVRKGRVVRVRFRPVGGSWSRLGSARERGTGNAVIPFSIGRSGRYEVQATLLRYGALPRVRGRVKTLKVTPVHSPVVTAHRGAAADVPENTMPSFVRALDRGADRLETDVQETADGVLVLFHDRALARTTDVGQKFPGREQDPLTTFTYAELATLEAGSSFDPAWAGTRIATFDEVLALVRGRGVGLLAETKFPDASPGIENRMLTHVRDAGLVSSRSNHRVVFESFDVGSLARFRELDPDTNVSPILMSFPADVSSLAWADSITLHAPDTSTDHVRAAHALGLEVNVWTPDTAGEVATYADRGVDSVITNRTALAVDVVR